VTGGAVLWVVGLACFIVALLGKEVTIGNIQIPATTQKRARAGIGIVGAMALILGAILVFYPANGQQPGQAIGTSGPSASRTTSPPDPTQGSPSSYPAVSSPSPTSSVAPAPGNADTATYLADMTASGANTPDVSSWDLLGHAYTHSIGFSDTCGDAYAVNYDLNGKFQDFDATVGVNDSDQSTSNEQAQFTIYGNPGGGPARKLREVPASWGAPVSISNLSVRGATLLTLVTADPNSCVMGEMVWGNARLTR